jgi:hypothetical protein
VLEFSPYTVHRLVCEPTEGIEELLEGLCGLGLALGVVSNSTFTGATLAWQLAECGLVGAWHELAALVRAARPPAGADTIAR